MFARMFRETERAAVRARRARRTPRHLIGSIALAAVTILLASFASAQAQTATSLTISHNPISSVFGQSVTFSVIISSATGTGAPTGTVTFSDGLGATFQVAAVPGINQSQATLTTTSLPAGSLTITATYSGDANFSGSSISTPFNVGGGGSQTSITSSQPSSAFGQSVTFTVTVSPLPPAMGTPTGTVILTVNGTPTTLTLSGGQATFTTSTLPPGNIPVLATYNGDGNFVGSNASFTQNVRIADTLNLMSSANPSILGQPVTFTATVPQGDGLTATGTVTFQLDGGSRIDVTLLNGQATFTPATLGASTHTLAAAYGGDINFSGSTASLTQTVKIGTTTTLNASPNPSKLGQAVTFSATISVASSSGPTGTVTFKDGSTTIGTVAVSGANTVTFTTSTLGSGNHSITAVYSGDNVFAPGTSAAVIEIVNGNSDSAKLRELQVSATPIIANAWAQSVTAAMDDAVTTGFSGNPRSLSPAGTGFNYYFDSDQPAQRSAESDQDALKRYLATPDGSTKRVDDDFGALGYAPMTTKAPPPALAAPAPHDWLAWINVRGTDFYRGTFGDDLKGEQVDAIAGLTRRLTSSFVVGVLGGYEHFDYTSQAFNGVLKGDGWTAGAFLGWKLSPNIRFDAGTAWSDLLANDTSGTASGNFLGTRWLVSGGLTGTYPWQMLVLEPSARVFALWEHENAYTDSLGTLQAARNFETGRASTGIKVAYPFAWSGTVALSPYAGLYAD
jgi:hypothetical protein